MASDSTILLDALGGTFKDNVNAPIHRWFRYPAGFSYGLVHQVFDHFGVTAGQIVLDPFAGSGTTLISAKQHGIESVGVEAHPLICRIGQSKLQWDLDYAAVRSEIDMVLRDVEKEVSSETETNMARYPELVHKCFMPEILQELHDIREVIGRYKQNSVLYGLLEIALLATLRLVSHVGTAQWQYILPNKTKAKTPPPPLRTFQDRLSMMLHDLESTPSEYRGVRSDLFLGDARDLSNINEEEVDLAFTSPPYLNNYDYADATRLELYFLGEARTWGEITKQVRDNLMTSTVTQIRRSERLKQPLLNHDIPQVIRHRLEGLYQQLDALRRERAGKKDYDLVMTGYFNDMFLSLRQVFKVLKKGAKYVLVVGDSAPYGVHIPTLELLGEIACSEAVGFESYTIHHLRDRNTKWKNRKHRVPLMEGVLVLAKP